MRLPKTEQELIKQLNDSYKTGLDDGKTVGRNEVLRNIAEPISLRDQFAIAALKGFIANPYYDIDEAKEQIASLCYEVSDAMLAERAKRGITND